MASQFGRVLAETSAVHFLQGPAYLLMETDPEKEADMFLYLPELGQIQRINSRMASGSVLGTDFSYEELQRLEGFKKDEDRRRLPDAVVEDHAVYVLEGHPSDLDESSYERIVSYIEQERCVMLKAEFFERGDRLRKRLTADPTSIELEKGLYIAKKVLMRDIRDETQTELLVQKINVGKKIPRRKLTLVELELGRD